MKFKSQRQPAERATNYVRQEHTTEDEFDIKQILAAYWEEIIAEYNDIELITSKLRRAEKIAMALPEQWRRMSDKETLFQDAINDIKEVPPQSTESALWQAGALVRIFPDRRVEIIDLMGGNQFFNQVKELMSQALKSDSVTTALLTQLANMCTVFPQLKTEFQQDLINLIKRFASEIKNPDWFTIAFLIPKEKVQPHIGTLADGLKQAVRDNVRDHHWPIALSNALLFRITTADAIYTDESGVHYVSPPKQYGSSSLPDRSIV